MVFKGEPKAGVSNLPLTNTWVFYNQSDTKILATTGSHFTLQLIISPLVRAGLIYTAKG